MVHHSDFFLEKFNNLIKKPNNKNKLQALPGIKKIISEIKAFI